MWVKNMWRTHLDCSLTILVYLWFVENFKVEWGAEPSFFSTMFQFHLRRQTQSQLLILDMFNRSWQMNWCYMSKSELNGVWAPLHWWYYTKHSVDFYSGRRKYKLSDRWDHVTVDSGFLDRERKTLLDDCRQTSVNIRETRMSLDSLNCRLNTGGLITKGLNAMDPRIIMMMLVS